MTLPRLFPTFTPMKNGIFWLLFLLIPLGFLHLTKKNKWREYSGGFIIRAVDEHGYYAYLPAIFIYGDLSFSFREATELKYRKKIPPYSDYRMTTERGRVNKYFAGTAVLQLPFFLATHAWVSATGGEADGYSFPYQKMLNLAAIFYLTLGLYFFNLFLKLRQIERWRRLITLYVVAFGTNILVYCVDSPGMSHIYSFAVVSFFMYSVQRFFSKRSTRLFLTAAVVYGLIVLLRPANGLVLFALPFLAGTEEKFKSGLHFLQGRGKYIAAAGLLAAAVVSIQLILYKMQTGHFFVYSYGEEGFDFTDSHFRKMLFSYKKGLFLYTPLAGIALSGLYFMRKYAAWSLLAFLILVNYILSCWYPWWYGGSFSGRVYIEYFPFIFTGFAVLLQRMRRLYFLLPFLLLTLLLVLWNQQQIVLYRWGVIHWEQMNEEKYREAFAKTAKLLRRSVKEFFGVN